MRQKNMHFRGGVLYIILINKKNRVKQEKRQNIQIHYKKISQSIQFDEINSKFYNPTI